MTPTLTVDRPCPTCGGTGKVSDTVASVAMGHISGRKCPDCEQGVQRVAVSCAGCRWYDRSHPNEETGWCRYHAEWICMTAYQGCTLWQAKEATDGNG